MIIFSYLLKRLHANDTVPNRIFTYLSVILFKIMRDVNYGWFIRYTHANVASFFFIFVYLHIGRGLYYGSFKSPRTLPWSIGVIILVLMMAIMLWPNCTRVDSLYTENTVIHTTLTYSLLPFNRSRTKAILRVGPHNLDVLSVLVCGLLGDW